ncbi:M20/M25/M40 family metallo-hydrolase [Actinosynnema sp. NPDC047251]|uniref:Aminopeptidase n=1 Tax=Saccharothrix espanaensis (strain ATCC 51144 / DSM 44229 / JCM 9112 / NBRC 15066 / NRRL 15764) TaxID=1179773 RepID=K0JXB3_SACES|nr:M20/M25/M40 family metallo-hydrolase [Saccharothrix espanaensis]CCH30711.1 Aminopeptidase [Saccharothrix espanaensis DSM 44229]
MRSVALALAAVTAVVTWGVPSGVSSGGTPAAGSEGSRLARSLSAAVQTRDAMDSVRAFDRIARENGGNREAGRPGYERSREYTEQVLRRAGYHVHTEPVPFLGWRTDVERLSAPGDVKVLMAQFVPSDAVTGRLARAAAAGCQVGDYPPGTVIAVVPSGTCPSGDKTVAARDAGVRAVLIYDVSPVPDTVLRRRVVGTPLPVGFISQHSAESLAAGDATLELRGHAVQSTTVNLFAETSGGDPASVVMAGAHLDSGADGPGINDNATSVAALLETAVRLAPHQKTVRNKVRFAFWGAEELVNLGSIHYIETRTPQQLAAISLYLNWELIASPNFVRFVVDGDDSDHPGTGAPAGPPGSGTVEAVLSEGYRVQHLPLRTADLNDIRSDQEPFAKAGIPVGGAFGGVRGIKTTEEAAVFGGTAGRPYDPCYHQPCDDLSNVHVGALGEAMRAMAWAVGRFAVDDDLRT